MLLVSWHCSIVTFLIAERHVHIVCKQDSDVTSLRFVECEQWHSCWTCIAMQLMHVIILPVRQSWSQHMTLWHGGYSLVVLCRTPWSMSVRMQPQSVLQHILVGSVKLVHNLVLTKNSESGSVFQVTSFLTHLIDLSQHKLQLGILHKRSSIMLAIFAQVFLLIPGRSWAWS